MLWFGIDRIHAYMCASTLVSAETETLWIVICLLEVSSSATILCEKQLIQTLPDTANVLPYITTLLLQLQNINNENERQCNHKAAYLLQDIEYMEQTIKGVLDISHDKEGKGSSRYKDKILHILYYYPIFFF